ASFCSDCYDATSHPYGPTFPLRAARDGLPPAIGTAQPRTDAMPLREPELPRRGHEASIEAPERRQRKGRGCEEVDIDPAEARTHQPVHLEEGQRFPMLHGARLRERLQPRENLRPISQPPTGELADDERVAQDLFVDEQPTKAVVASAQMIHPDRGIDEDHA